MRIDIIKSAIQEIPFVQKLINIEQREFSIIGNVEINFKGLDQPLIFDFNIEKEYPLKSYNTESITFYNKKLLPYSHIMEKGNICIHTSHSTDLREKIHIDFNSLKDWITKYYINKGKDSNYEHIIVNESTINEIKYAYVFTDVKNKFKKGDYGFVELSLLNIGIHRDKPIQNFYIKSFKNSYGKEISNSQWSEFYLNQKTHIDGFYYFVEEAPAKYKKFAFTNWQELSFSQSFLQMLHHTEKTLLKKNKGKNKGLVIPLFLGYKISENEIHWQAALLEVGSFPFSGVPEKINNVKTGKWFSEIVDSEIKWGITNNSSYKYFFGRGVFSEKLTSKKILIIGIGAVGSMIAKTLTQCGCTHIDFIDYDIKYPENVCRSEYKFSNGITNKTEELEKILYEISPFVESKKLNNHYFEKYIKSFFDTKESEKKIRKNLEDYDLIFDCTTDNDLMLVLDSLELKTDLVNVSITNHAKELVFGVNPNIYSFVNNQFSNVLQNDIENLYEPTGCWSPTFKGSYNDIATLVQVALKHYNKIEKDEKSKNNFVVQETIDGFKVIEY